ncbi:MAG: hypothetical protein CSA62_01375 [Planctomycetota bacterium]|nr:MAG: hypothetical protein CSA62_01375 [Planctomycetota bacterium]
MGSLRRVDRRRAKTAHHLKRIGKFYAVLREVRHQLFDDEFVAEQVANANAVVNAKMDKRRQVVLGTLGEEESRFSQGVLVRFRERMVAHDLDRKLLNRTVHQARASGEVGWQQAKAALDSSPLLGAGRVEDT